MKRLLFFLTLALLPVPAQTTRELADDSVASKLVHAALDRTHQVVRYEPAYVKLDYPGILAACRICRSSLSAGAPRCPSRQTAPTTYLVISSPAPAGSGSRHRKCLWFRTWVTVCPAGR
jgi:hypothetical protein